MTFRKLVMLSITALVIIIAINMSRGNLQMATNPDAPQPTEGYIVKEDTHPETVAEALGLAEAEKQMDDAKAAQPTPLEEEAAEKKADEPKASE